jgi:hypothetical protein
MIRKSIKLTANPSDTTVFQPNSEAEFWPAGVAGFNGKSSRAFESTSGHSLNTRRF